MSPSKGYWPDSSRRRLIMTIEFVVPSKDTGYYPKQSRLTVILSKADRMSS